MICSVLDMPYLKIGVHLFVGSNEEISAATKKSVFDVIPNLDTDVFAGRALYSGADFGIQFVKSGLTHGVITHEVYHVVHRIWNYLGDSFSVDHSEPYAFLCEFLTDWVYKQLKKGKVRVG